jgi:precorrin-6A/cobalt-precorrin-6A reductase
MQLAALLADNGGYAPLMSFAGRTEALRLPRIPHRVGGFGGAEGLAAYLRENRFAAVVDATHPFAVRMSANAAAACGQAHLPLMVLTRPAWKRQRGDDWIEVDSFEAAAAALGETPRTVFLTVGRQELAAFRGGIPHRYVVRTVDAPDTAALPEGAKVILARGPFDAADERQLMRDTAIEVVVTKNSGGAATYGKIAAARELGLPVVMINRPRAAAEGELHDAAAVLAWLEALRATHDAAS